MIVCGELTGSGTGTDYTVTMDNTATTTFGKMDISRRGSLVSQLTAATNYYLKLAGNLELNEGGTLQIGTSGGAMPADSTFTIEFVSTTAAEFGFTRNGGICQMQGATKTPWANLAADAAAAATSITLDVSPTGWRSGDVLAFAPTTAISTQAESKATTGAPVGATVAVAAITNAHGGSAATGVIGEVGNLTRNIKIKGTSAALTGYVSLQSFSGATARTCDMYYVEFFNLGSALSLRRGIDIGNNVGVTNFVGNAIHTCTVASATAINHPAATTGANLIDNNVTYNAGGSTSTSQGAALNVTATTGVPVITNNLFILAAATGSPLVFLSDIGCTFTGNHTAGCPAAGVTYSETATLGTHSNNHSHSNVGNVRLLSAPSGGTMSGYKIWRSADVGLDLLTGAVNTTFDSFTFFGNVSAGLYMRGRLYSSLFLSCVFNAGTGDTQPRGILVSTDVGGSLEFRDCDFGVTQAHSSADLAAQVAHMGVLCHFDIGMENCRLASATQVANQSTWGATSIVKSWKHGQVSGANRAWKPNGTLTQDSAIFQTASPSLRLTPNSASLPLQSGDHNSDVTANMDSAATAVVTVWVRKSVVGDGTAYNGNQPRLMLRTNRPAGITVDTVIATAAAAAGAWEQLSGTLPAPTDNTVYELFIDCDGTAGWVNVDDWGLT
ncbi:MAG: hypothetical protein H0X04_00050 [Chthoniobacterales bacterium]|nr:hypothetical protein [Chthoniobacterales bacterium]